ncbi:MAG: insulinase family protein [Bacteroidales bacterium]|nr:insulinase family protein [Bacteroidales bacterium]MCF8405118.1 insulinase family protein [Bacteroidales bacterium]
MNSTKTWQFLTASTALLAFFALFVSSCTQEGNQVETITDSNGFTYEYIKGDPSQARIYTLENGLKVYLSYNADEPRVSTLIGVRAGSTSEPEETTGLAHYFEHMMFKGTDEIGTLDWEKEKAALDQISDLFEAHRATNDSLEKKFIYQQIDSVSQIAASYVAANEYDKMVSSLGAKRTNAGTSYESTVYINDIPTNEFEKWLKLESERFKDIVLRLFHTELETVYEEFNMYQDMDRSRANKALMEGLFPTHPYGRSVIGLPEHLKNPSLVNIYKFAETWYRPNNMAVAIAGDIQPEEAIVLINKYFGSLEANPELPDLPIIVEEPITEPIVKEVVGPDAESLSLAFRFEGDDTGNEYYVSMIDMILSNSQAGLIDINLNQKQKVLRAGGYSYFLRDYGLHSFYGQPREGQSLEEVKDLILGEIEKIKKGEFDDWLMEAVVNDMRLTEIRRDESNFARAYGYISTFIDKKPYSYKLNYINELEKISKDQLVQFAIDNYKNNYVVVYKRTGENTGLVKVEKPKITPIEINREDQSEFYKEFSAEETPDIDPVFVDFANEISSESLNSGIEVSYIKNKTNELFELQYIIDMGKNHNLLLPLAFEYLPYLGTSKYSAEDLQKEFFKYGLTMDVYASNDRCYVNISGIGKSFDKGVELLEHVLSNVEPDQDAYNDYVDGILKSRNDAKLNKNTILWSGLFNYGKYGSKNPFTHIISDTDLKNIDPSELTTLLREIYAYKHRMFYYGSEELADVIPVLEKYHNVPEVLLDYPAPVLFVEQESSANNVYFVDYDMSQVNIILMAKGPQFDKNLIPPARLFGEYFGGGLSSIVFQEIREARGLAYSAFSAFADPQKKDQSYFVYGFVGTQVDKLKEATDALLDLMNNMPKAQKQFDLAKESILKKIETERIIKTNIFWTYQRNLDRGIDYDIREDVYNYVKDVDMNNFSEFFDNYIKDNNYSFLILANKNEVDMNVLGQLGTVKELRLKEVFNY